MRHLGKPPSRTGWKRIQLIARSPADIGQMGVGLAAFARPDRQWLFHVARPGSVSAGQLREDRIDAVVAGGKSKQLASELRKWGGLVVSLSEAFPGDAVVCFDDRAAGRQAAEHFIQRGLKHFGFASDADTIFTQHRLEGFTEALAAAGRAGQTLRVDQTPTLSRRLSTAGEKLLADWLGGLPHPVGILAARAEVGVQLAQAAWGAGIRVPEQAAIVCCGGGAFCELAYPPLSSVDPNGHQLGLRVGQVLADLFDGRDAPAEPVGIPPLELTVRPSSDIYAVEDADLAAALEFIRENAHRPIAVADVAEAASLSRRVLERRFARHLQRTPHEQICQVRVAAACRLLARTSLPVEQVARRCGFANNSRLVEQFVPRVGCTPSAYRYQRQA